MTVNDGSVLGVTKIVDNGLDSKRWNLVILGDGYQNIESPRYLADVDRFVRYFRTVEPFKGLWGKINIHQVEVASHESFADDPANCQDGTPANPPSGSMSATYFDSTFCFGGAYRRALGGDSQLALNVAQGQVFSVNAVLVIVNGNQDGGGGGPLRVAWCSNGSSSMEQVAVHELAHAYFDLADEYGGNGGSNLGSNVTSAITRSTIPWGYLIPSSAPIPMLPNPSSTSDNNNGSPFPAAGTVGLFEGAGGGFQRIYRSEYVCKMRFRWEPFCKVCEKLISAKLAQFGGSMNWEVNGNSFTNTATDFLGTIDNNPLIIKTNNTEKVRIAANGDVFVRGASSTPGALFFQHATGTIMGKIWTALSPMAALQLNMGGKDPGLSVNFKGFVGVGTDRPRERLEVSDGSLLMTATKGNPGDIIFQGKTGVQKARIWSEPGSNKGLHLSSGNRTPNVSIDLKGNVGIGTTTPGEKLEVNGGNLLLKSAGNNVGDIIFYGGSAPKARIWSEPGAGAGLNLSSGDTTPDITISASGNIGMGTTQPNSKLEVRSTLAGGSALTVFNVADGAALWATSSTTMLPTSAFINSGAAAAVLGRVDQTTNTSFAVVGLAGSNAISPTAAFPGGGGVLGKAPEGSGVIGLTLGLGSVGNGVEGRQVSSSAQGAGVHGVSESRNGVGVFGANISGGGLAGSFIGNVSVNGTTLASAKAFKIDHPLEPTEKFLNHSSVESPDMMTVYNGNTKTNDRCEAMVELPKYFEALNKDFRYQLTVIGELALVAVSSEIKDNCFVIKSDQPNVKVSWQVTGIRNDAYARENRISVEEKKSDEQRGRYLHPDLFLLASDKPDAKLPIGALAGMFGTLDANISKAKPI